MIQRELTSITSPARTPSMGIWHANETRSGWRAVRAALVLMAGSLAGSGCVSVTAPDKPIVIELNINIKQEVVYRLSADAANTIDKNPDIF
jgi:hypothetical protein